MSGSISFGGVGVPGFALGDEVKVDLLGPRFRGAARGAPFGAIVGGAIGLMIGWPQHKMWAFTGIGIGAGAGALVGAIAA